MQHTFVLAFIGALAVGAAASVFFELRGLASWMSWTLLKLAIALVPAGVRRDDLDEEWRATWATWGDGAFGRLVWAATLCVAGGRIGYRVRREGPAVSTSETAGANADGVEDGGYSGIKIGDHILTSRHATTALSDPEKSGSFRGVTLTGSGTIKSLADIEDMIIHEDRQRRRRAGRARGVRGNGLQ